MINWLRKPLQAIFGIEAAFFVPFFPLQIYFLLRLADHAARVRVATLLPGSALASAAGGIYLAAWWSIKKNKVSSRWWGLAASLINIALTFFILRYTEIHLVSIIWLVPISGLIGVFVFSRKLSLTPVSATPRLTPPIAGDGTSAWMNKIGPALTWTGSVGVFIWWLRWTRANNLHTQRGLMFWSELILTIIVVVTLHELGHCVVGCALGMKLRSFVAGPFQWRIREGKWAFKFNPLAILTPEGAVGVVPISDVERRWRDVCMVAAGPLVNIATAIVTLYIAFRTASGAPLQMSGLTALFGGYSLITGVCNLIPLRVGNSYSDGARIYQILSRGPFADLHRALSVVTSSLVSPLRPRDYDLQSIERASASAAQGTQLLLLHAFRCQYYLDRGMLPEAAEAITAAENIYHKESLDIPAELHTSFVFDAAYAKRNPVSAREWWERMEAKKPTRVNADYWLAHSALHWIEGNLKAANESWRKGNVIAQQLPQAGAYDFDRHRCSLLRQAIDESEALRESILALPTLVEAF